jgi:hypothetical protein
MKDSNISFWVVPHEIATLDLGLTEKSILAVVFSFTRNGGECWATDKQFAVAFGMGERTIERAISRLYLLGYLERHVERKAGGVTPRRLSMTLPYRQIDATPHGELTPYRQIDATLAPNCPPPTVKMTLGYRQNDAQIVNNKNKEKEYIISTPLSQDDTPTPPEKNEVLKPDSVIKDSLTSEEPPLNEVPIPSKKSRHPKEPMTLCPAPSVWLTPERMDRLKGIAREVPSWGSLSDSDLETAIKNLSYRMHIWSEGKKKQRAGWEMTFRKWLPGNNPELQERALSDSTKRDNARDLFSRLVKAASEASRFHSAFEKVPILAKLYDSDEAIKNYRDQLKPLEKGTKDYEITEAVFVKRFLDKASQCQR